MGVKYGSKPQTKQKPQQILVLDWAVSGMIWQGNVWYYMLGCDMVFLNEVGYGMF